MLVPKIISYLGIYSYTDTPEQPQDRAWYNMLLRPPPLERTFKIVQIRSGFQVP